MDTELLKTFLEVRKTRHFGRAADNLYLTQSAVSFRIRQLEQAMGVALFTRERNNIRLTAAGERLVPHAEAMLTSLQRAKTDVSLSDSQSHQLNLAGTANVWDCFLHMGLSHICAAIPSAALKAEVASHEQIVRQLLERTLDLGFLFDPPKLNQLNEEHIFTVNLLPVSTTELQEDEDLWRGFIQIDWGTAFAVEQAQNFPNTPPPQFRTSTSRIAYELMLNCGGMAYLPEYLALELIQDEALFVINQLPKVQKPIFVASHIENENRPLLEEIICLLDEGVNQNAGMFQQLEQPN